jgi:hypothetical protein
VFVLSQVLLTVRELWLRHTFHRTVCEAHAGDFRCQQLSVIAGMDLLSKEKLSVYACLAGVAGVRVYVHFTCAS